MMKKALVLSLSLGLVGNVSANNVDALVALAQAEGMEAVEQVIAQAALEDQSEVNVIKKHKKLLLTVAGTAAATAAVVVLGQMAYNSYKTPASVKLANKIVKAAKAAKDDAEFNTAVGEIYATYTNAEDKGLVENAKAAVIAAIAKSSAYSQKDAVAAFVLPMMQQEVANAEIAETVKTKVAADAAKAAAEQKAKEDAEKTKQS